MEFRILGPLEAVANGRAVPLGGGKQRALLTLLLLHANETITTDRLIDELWGERPPATAAKTVQVHISRLRKALDDSSILLTREHGYTLAIDPEALDANRFERLLGEGSRELAAGRPDHAVPALTSALSLWRGAPLSGLAHEPFAQSEIGRLEELRLAALEQLIEAKLALGRHAEVVARLEALIAEHPYRERLRAQLMLALYRSDRQADALQAFQDARRTLVDELGIEPGQRLRKLEQAILAQDEALALPVPPPAERPAPEPLALPATLQLAAGTPFVAREAELARLRQLWARGERATVVLAGEAGIGKTRLAAEFARGVRGSVLYGRCDEGLAVPYQPFVQALRPVASTMGAERMRSALGSLMPELARLLPDVAEPAEPARADPEMERLALFEAVAALIEAVTRQRRALLVLDDLHWAPAPTLLMLRHLVRSERRLRVVTLATYRDTELDPGDPLAQLLADLRRDGSVEAMPIGGLDERAVATLLDAAGERALGERVAQRIATETGGNPLFIREVVAHLIESGRPEIVIPQELRQVIDQRVARLSEAARRALRVAAVVGPTFSVPIVERVMSDAPGVIDALDEAASAGLLAEAGHGDYGFAHALVRQTIYDGLGTARRMRLHRQVGEALEASGDAPPEALAHHFAEAAKDGQARKAASYALAAGRSAVRRAGYDEAAAHYERGLRALEAAGGPNQKLRRELLLALGRTHYEPLPDLSELPRWIWRRLPRAGKIAVALVPAVVIALVLAFGPGIERAKQERTLSLAQQRDQMLAARAERLRVEQRPRRDRGTPAHTDLAARERLLDEVAAAIRGDARERVAAGALAGPILRVECEPFPRRLAGTAPHDEASARTGRYACLAVTSDLQSGAPAPVGASGHPYRARIDFQTGRYAFCKIAGSPGKTLPTTRDPLVPLPRACGGS
jgi:DNA-binding SARP family transcriptional activator